MKIEGVEALVSVSEYKASESGALMLKRRTK
jgi:hypothetical protein